MRMLHRYASVYNSNTGAVTALHFLVDARGFAQKNYCNLQPFCPFASSFLMLLLRANLSSTRLALSL